MTQPEKLKTLYICYFGLREPLVQTQVIPYLLEIIKDSFEVSLLTFEPDFNNTWSPEQIKTEQKLLREKGIEWHSLPYHKWPTVPATLLDIFNGVRVCKKLIGQQDFDVLHCRVHVPMLMAVLARKLSRKKPKILFDIRGFFPEEYTDAGIWPENGWLYRIAKRIERWLLNEADGFVVLTEKARKILFPESTASGFDESGRPVEVIPCCVDLAKFAIADEASREKIRHDLDIGDRFVVAYAGSFGGWYLSDEMFDFFVAARDVDPAVFILVLTQRDAESAGERLSAIGFAKSDFYVGSVLPMEIPYYLNAADAAVSFIRRCYSKQASSPTKNAEYLASGLPIIANAGVGDVDSLLTTDGVGVLIKKFDCDEYTAALKQVKSLGDIREKCRASARRHFDVGKVGGQRYRSLYRRLLRTGRI